MGNGVSNNLKNKLMKLEKKRVASNKVVNIFDYKKASGSGRPSQALMVSKDFEVTAVIERLLETIHVELECSEDAISFSKKLNLGGFDIVIIDDSLNWLSGGELSAIVKNHNGFNQLPIVLLSDIDAADSCGASQSVDAVIPKPINAVDFVSVVNIFLNDMNKSIDTI